MKYPNKKIMIEKISDAILEYANIFKISKYLKKENETLFSNYKDFAWDTQ